MARIDLQAFLDRLEIEGGYIEGTKGHYLVQIHPKEARYSGQAHWLSYQLRFFSDRLSPNGTMWADDLKEIKKILPMYHAMPYTKCTWEYHPADGADNA